MTTNKNKMEKDDEIKKRMIAIRPQLNREIKYTIVPPNTPLYKITVFRHYTAMANTMYANGYLT